MTDIEIDLDGAVDLQETLDDVKDDIEDPPTWIVGSAVEYAVYLEFGTRKMDPKPTFRPAFREAEASLSEFIASNTRTTLQQIDDADELVQTVALALERRIKELITQKGLIDTGVFRASVVAVPIGYADALPSAEDFNVPDEGTVDPQAGRRIVAQTTVDV